MSFSTLPSTYRKQLRLDGDHWIWTGRMVGNSAVRGAGLQVARILFEQEVGLLAHYERLYHDCPVARCVNPAHRRIGKRGAA